MRLNTRLPKQIWPKVVHVAVYLINRLPNSTLDGKVVEEVWIGNPVDYVEIKA